MARRRPFLAWAIPLRRDRFGRPVDPGYGVGEGGEIDQGLPDDTAAIDPGYGVEGGAPGHLPSWGRPGRPGHGLPRPPWERPSWPPGPVDPDWGIDAEQPEGPIYIPGTPDNSLPLPPIDGAPEIPTTKPPPGTVWPPLPPSAPPGRAALLVWISGVGFRYVVIEVPQRGAGQLPAR
jgi:hypothetical protein